MLPHEILTYCLVTLNILTNVTSRNPSIFCDHRFLFFAAIVSPGIYSTVLIFFSRLTKRLPKILSHRTRIQVIHFNELCLYLRYYFWQPLPKHDWFLVSICFHVPLNNGMNCYYNFKHKFSEFKLQENHPFRKYCHHPTPPKVHFNIL